MFISLHELSRKSVPIDVEFWDLNKKPNRLHLSRKFDFKHISARKVSPPICIPKYDIICVPFLIQSLNSVCLQFLGSGVPIISDRSPFGSNVLEGPSAGWIINRNWNPEDFKKLITEISNNPESVYHKGNIASEVVKKNHSWAAFKSNILSIYN